MPFDWASVTGKITRSLMSSSGLKVTSISSPSGPDDRLRIFGLDASRAVGSTLTAAVGGDRPGPERQRRDVPFADGAQAQDEAQPPSGAPDWSGCGTMLGLNKRRGLERIFVQKIGADQAGAGSCVKAAWPRSASSISSARASNVSSRLRWRPWKFSSTSASWLAAVLGIERENPVDDMVGAGLVGRVEVARFGRRLERAHDDPGRIGPQIKGLPVQEGGLRQGVLGSLEMELRFGAHGATAPRAWSAAHRARASCRISARPSR